MLGSTSIPASATGRESMSAIVESPTQAPLRAQFREFVRADVEPIASEHDRSGTTPLHLTQSFFDCGFPQRFFSGPDMPEATFLTDACVAAEELAYGSAAIASLLMLPVFFDRLVLKHLQEPARSIWHERLLREPVVTAFAASERAAGSDVMRTEVRADPSGDDYVLHGRKEYSSNVRNASFAIVVARTGPAGLRASDSLTWFLVDMAAPGVNVGDRWPTLGLRAMDLSPLELNGVRVPRSFVLGGEGRGLALMANSLSQSRTGIAAVALGIARRARDEVLRFAKERVLYGERLYRLQDYRFRIAEIEKDISAARALVDRSASRHDLGLDHTKDASIAKLFAGEMVMRVTETALLMFGSRGYAGEGVMERLFRDARHIAIVEGNEPIHKELIFTSLLRHGGD
jgi:alkylation response protein AidB-like acyl-CoA dehydrogenase